MVIATKGVVDWVAVAATIVCVAIAIAVRVAGILVALGRGELLGEGYILIVEVTVGVFVGGGIVGTVW